MIVNHIMPIIRLKLLGQEHSTGRGVGFYRSHLAKSLEDTGSVKFVDTGEQIVHYPFFDLFYPTLPKKFNSPTVVTVHDVAPLVLSKLYPLGLRARFALHSQIKSLRNANAIITDSISSKNDLIQHLGLPIKKIFVTYLAADEIYATRPSISFSEETKKKYNLPDRFVLYVGGVNPNKNVLRLARVCIQIGIPLVLVGKEFTQVPLQTFSIKKYLGLQAVHPELSEIKNIKSLVDKHDSLITTGFVPDEDLNAIYRLATVYCQPSLYEGFGLPLLEAMTAECLVISSNSSSLPEIYPSNSLVFNPASDNEIEETIVRAMNLSIGERKKIIETATQKAKEFSWKKTARDTVDVYQSVLQSNNA